jgi:hypothetical protein
MTMVPVVSGYPDPATLIQAEEGLLTLGGCIVTGDDPPLACTACGAEMWPGGVFRSAGYRALAVGIGGRPGRTGHSAFFHHLGDLGFIAPGRRRPLAQTSVLGSDVPTLLMLLCVGLFPTGERLTAWLRYRHLPWLGELNGPVERFLVGDDLSLIAIGAASELFVPCEQFERLVLSAIRSQGFRTVDRFDGWLRAYGIERADV